MTPERLEQIKRHSKLGAVDALFGHEVAELLEELDQLRKDLELAIAERDLARHQRDMRGMMLDDANEREQKLIELLGEFKRRWPLVYDELTREKPTPMCQDPEAGTEMGRPT